MNGWALWLLRSSSHLSILNSATVAFACLEAIKRTEALEERLRVRELDLFSASKTLLQEADDDECSGHGHGDAW